MLGSKATGHLRVSVRRRSACASRGAVSGRQVTQRARSCAPPSPDAPVELVDRRFGIGKGRGRGDPRCPGLVGYFAGMRSIWPILRLKIMHYL